MNKPEAIFTESKALPEVTKGKAFSTIIADFYFRTSKNSNQLLFLVDDAECTFAMYTEMQARKILGIREMSDTGASDLIGATWTGSLYQAGMEMERGDGTTTACTDSDIIPYQSKVAFPEAVQARRQLAMDSVYSQLAQGTDVVSKAKEVLAEAE